MTYDTYLRPMEDEIKRKYFRHARFKGGSSVTNTTTYTASPEERRLQAAEAKYSEAVSPNALWLNNIARNVLENSLGTVQVDFNGLNNEAQQRIAAANQGMADLTQGKLPTAYTQNMTDAIKSGVQNTYGDLINNAAAKGVLNSSVTSQGLSDISKNVADTMAQSYSNNINQLANLYGNQQNAATNAITTAAAAQEAAQQPAINLWNASLGLNGATTGALAASAGKGTTTNTQTTSGGGGGLFGSILGAGLGGLASGWASCFPTGTSIRMEDGTEKDIKDVQEGDFVQTTKGPERVLAKMPERYNDTYTVTAEKGAVTTTLTQPLMKEDGDYIYTADLTPGVALKGKGKVLSVEKTGEHVRVYDMMVDGVNNYYADGFIAVGGDGKWREA